MPAYSDVIEDSCERMIMVEGPLTADEIQEKGVQTNWLCVSGYNGSRAPVPIGELKRVLRTSDRFVQDDGKRYHLFDNTDSQ